MGLFSLFTSGLRNAVANAVRLGFADGVKSVLGDQQPAGNVAEVESAESEVRLLLLPAPEEEPAESTSGVKGRKRA